MFSHPEGVHIVTKDLQFTPSKSKSAPKSLRKTIYTHTSEYVRDNMIILLHTIIYLISHKFRAATDSYVFRVKWVINISIFYYPQCM